MKTTADDFPGMEHEPNPHIDIRAYHDERHQQEVIPSLPWTYPGLRITRLRLISDRGFPAWDVSYCHGTHPEHGHVDVQLPFHQLPKRGTMRAIVEHAKRDGVYAKRLGIFDCISKLNV